MERVDPRVYSRCVRRLAYRGLLDKLRQLEKLVDLTIPAVEWKVYRALCGRHATNRYFDLALREALEAVRVATRVLRSVEEWVRVHIHEEIEECRSVVLARFGETLDELESLERLIRDAIEATSNWLELSWLTKGDRRRLQCWWLEYFTVERRAPTLWSIIDTPSIYITNGQIYSPPSSNTPLRLVRSRSRLRPDYRLERYLIEPTLDEILFAVR